MISGKIIRVCDICEAQNIWDVESLRRVDMMGFISYPESPRYVYELPAYLPVHVHRVGVFINKDEDVVTMYVDRFGLEYIRLHGKEPPEYCQSLHTSDLKVIKTFSVARPKNLNHMSEYEKICDLFLFGAKCEQYGGSGNQFDRNILHTHNGQAPFLLSGGINSHSANALKAFSHPCLAGYDLNSRLELKPGEKDPERIRISPSELES